MDALNKVKFLQVHKKMSKLNTNLKFKNGKSKFTVNGIIFISLKQENITDFDTVGNLSQTKNIGENVSFKNCQ